jgi:hypothetical protein
VSATNGLCPAGRATLEAHEKTLDQHKQRLDKVDGKLDHMIYLIVATLVGVVVELGYTLLNGR